MLWPIKYRSNVFFAYFRFGRPYRKPSIGNEKKTFSTKMEDFTNVKDGCDAFGCNKISQKVTDDSKTAVYIATGGQIKQ